MLTIITWLLTALGASFIFFIKSYKQQHLDILLGFTGGVMMAASIWSLIIPSIELCELSGLKKYFPALSGCIIGFLFIFLIEKIIHYYQQHYKKTNSSTHKNPKISLLVFAITLHNIPEGMAIGVLIGSSMDSMQTTSMLAAITLAIGIGIQNIPEGLAVAIPFKRKGYSNGKSFFWGQLSAIVEPIAAVLGVLLIVHLGPLLPYALSFAAGAMIYVVLSEVLPVIIKSSTKRFSILSTIIGFLIMMILDIGLG